MKSVRSSLRCLGTAIGRFPHYEPNIDPRNQQTSQLPVVVFEIDEFDFWREGVFYTHDLLYQSLALFVAGMRLARKDQLQRSMFLRDLAKPTHDDAAA